MQTETCFDSGQGHLFPLRCQRRRAARWTTVCIGAVLALPLLGFGARAWGQGTATGLVLDVSTNLPLAGVEVVIDGLKRIGTTDEAGRYLMSGVPVGRRIVLFRKVGYRPLRTMTEFQRGDTTVVDGAIIGLAVRLDSILVRGAENRTRGMGVGREAFEERRSRGFGLFFDSTDMRRNEHRTLGDMARNHVGIYVPASRYGGGVIYNYRRNPPCPLFIFLDGNPRGVADTREFPVHTLESAEIYNSVAGLPAEYGGARAQCGVILLWSRRGP